MDNLNYLMEKLMGFSVYFTYFLLHLQSQQLHYYSIVGLMAIFAGATTCIAIMGVVLEVGKLVVASWTFQNWKTTAFMMKVYFIFAVLVLMFITSLGIFGFLSRAHIQQSNPTALLEERIERIEIKTEQKQEQIGRYEGRLEILDKALERYIELGAVTRGLNKIAESDNETTLLKSRIDTLEGEIDDLTDEKYELKTKLNLAEVEVGPIRYIGRCYMMMQVRVNLKKAVRWIIILLIFVFDPLAVVLVIALCERL